MAEDGVTRRSLRDQAAKEAAARDAAGKDATGRRPARASAAPPPPAPAKGDRPTAQRTARTSAPQRPAASTARAATARKGAGDAKLPARRVRWWRGAAILVLLGAIFFGVGAAVGLYLFGR